MGLGLVKGTAFVLKAYGSLSSGFVLFSAALPGPSKKPTFLGVSYDDFLIEVLKTAGSLVFRVPVET